MYYNLVQIHQTLKMTPAIFIGVTQPRLPHAHVWCRVAAFFLACSGKQPQAYHETGGAFSEDNLKLDHYRLLSGAEQSEF